MMKNKDFAGMATQLQIPHVVLDIFEGDGALTDDIELGMHEVISEMQPDSALLAVALSTHIIASYYITASPSMQVLVMECERMIEEYGPFWLKNADGETLDEGDVLNVLETLVEDLQSLQELLELNTCFLDAKDPVAAQMFRILDIQTGAQALIAESILGIADQDYQETPQISIAATPANTVLDGDNVIAFPGFKREEKIAEEHI